jgi:FlgD Ig-like domain
VAAFAALVVATVGAFFVTQHLKVTTPLIAGEPAPFPAWINPVNGNTCYDSGANPPRYVSHRYTTLSFYLLHRADYVDVWVVDHKGRVVATLATSRYMAVRQRTGFVWNGREADGSLAPDGMYYFRVGLLQQNRTLEIATAAGQPLPVVVRTVPPRPVVTSVIPSVLRRTGGSVTIHYTGNENRGGMVRIYRVDLPGQPRVKSFPTPWGGQTAIWNGRINNRRAAPGAYLIGLDVTDGACNTGTFPPVRPAAPASIEHAVVTVL